MLEPDVGKLASPVLRGRGGGKSKTDAGFTATQAGFSKISYDHIVNQMRDSYNRPMQEALDKMKNSYTNPLQETAERMKESLYSPLQDTIKTL